MRDDEETKIKLVHRLDKDTSGVMVVAKSRWSAMEMSTLFKKARTSMLSKYYLSFLCGTPLTFLGKIKQNVMKVSGPHGERVRGLDPEKDAQLFDKSRLAVTEYEILQSSGKSASLGLFSPKTGRTHQIRSHARDALGTPILGKKKKIPTF